jgi:glycosyltransferase involved in cell wall biosynthesis
MYDLAEKVVTCYNTNDVLAIHRLSSENMTISGWNDLKDDLRLVTVGRLGPEKGFDRLLNCCAKLRDDGLQFKLLIIGQGSEETNLKELQHHLNLEDIVIFGGYQSNPFPYVKNADLFVVSSRQEGLNTAMSESLILGTPVISTLVSGATEVLGENSEYGLVVDNDDAALYEGLKKLLSSPDLLAHYRMKAKERASFFDTAKTVKAVEDLIDSLVKR